MSLSKRIKQARKNARLNQYELAKLVGCSQGLIGNLESGHTKASNKLNAIARVLGVSLDWLENENNAVSTLNQNRKTITFESKSLVPLYDIKNLIKNFIGSDQENHNIQMVNVLINQKLSSESFALILDDNSMSPTCVAGDIFIFDPKMSIKPGSLVLALLNLNEIVLRKYKLVNVDERGENLYELIPSNQDYPTLNSEMHSIKLLGRAVCFQRSLITE